MTDFLVQRVMGWRVGPERFFMTERCWIPRWRFTPTKNLEHAFQLLEEAAPDDYSMWGDDKGNCRVQIRMRGSTGEANDVVKARAITFAIARALRIKLEGDDHAE